MCDLASFKIMELSSGFLPRGSGGQEKESSWGDSWWLGEASQNGSGRVD